MREYVCGECGIHYLVSDDFDAARRADGATFYCPRGHARHFVVDEPQLAVERLAQRGREMSAEWSATRAALRIERKSHAATKGRLTRALKQIGRLRAEMSR